MAPPVPHPQESVPEQRRKGYVLTPRRRAAARANLQKALAARRRPQGNARARLNALKHGLFAQSLEDSVRRLNEDPKEYEALLRLFEQVYVPEDEVETKLVRRLAETVWRRLRLFRAQARWETDRLKGLFAAAPSAAKLTAEQTQRRAFALVDLLNSFDPLFTRLARFESRIESLLRALLRKRSGGSIEFKVLARKRDPLLAELEKDFAELQALDRWLHLTPRQRQHLWERVNAEVRSKTAKAGRRD